MYIFGDVVTWIDSRSEQTNAQTSERKRMSEVMHGWRNEAETKKIKIWNTQLRDSHLYSKNSTVTPFEQQFIN